MLNIFESGDAISLTRAYDIISKEYQEGPERTETTSFRSHLQFVER